MRRQKLNWVITLKRCAQRCSPSLHNKIKGLTGNTPSDLIRIYRINKAKLLLQGHRHTITEIAEMVGFADQKYFREVFKKATGMTPSEYAKSKE